MPDRDLVRALLGGGSAADEVLADAGVDAAVGGKSSGALYGALRRARKSAKSTDVRMALDHALSKRRAFVDPIVRAPTMYTLNGVGTRLYGSSDTAPDGTHVKTLYFTVLYVPIVPLACYLVRDAGSRSWNFHAKVPLAPMHRVWHLAAAGTALAAAAIALWFTSSHG
jgi:hypothetical protein